jgi:hypothetical protein
MSLPRPGVEVLQVFRSVSPSVITPTLMANITGVAKQIVELNVSSGAGGSVLNPDALVQLPAALIAKAAVGSPPVYGGLDGLALQLSFNGGVPISTTLVDATASGITPASFVAQVQKAFLQAGVTAAYPELVGDGLTQFQIRTVGTGDFESIYVTSNTAVAVAAALGIGVGKTYSGRSNYNQYTTVIPATGLPDPRGNIDELGIELDTIRAFLSLGSGQGVRESLRDTAFLRNGVVNDPAVVTGTVDLAGLSYPGAVGTTTIILTVGTGTSQTITFASPANAAAVVSQINAGSTDLVASLQTGTNRLVLTSDAVGGGLDARINITGGTAIATLGITTGLRLGANIAVVDDGDGDTLSPLLKFAGETFTTTPTAAVVTSSQAATNPADDTTLIFSDGQQVQTVVFKTVAAFADIVTQINAISAPAAGGLITASDAGSSVLRLTHSKLGTDSVIHILGGTALAALNPGGSPTLVAGTYRASAPSLPEVGDELWIDGEFVGGIRAVAPGGVVDTLRLDRLLPVSATTGSYFYLVAKNLPGSASRPAPDLVIGTDASVRLKLEQLRDTIGVPVGVQAPIYLTYAAVRKDVSPRAANPNLLVFDDTTQLEDTLSPITPANPLGFGLYFALLNGQGTQVSGLGVDEISADAPFGTVDAYLRAAEFLEGREIYATTPLTHDQTVHQLWKAHAEKMSEPTSKGERVAVVSLQYPSTKLDTLVASGTNGNSTSTTVFTTGVANLAALLLNAGITPTGTVPASKGLFLDIATDGKRYSIQSISGAQVTIRTSFAPGENDDSFYSTAVLPTPLIQEAFAIRIRGAALVTVSGDSDKNAIAETVAQIGQTYGSRRLWMVTPDTAAATVDGLEQVIEGFYLTAGICGLIGAQPPQQSFTNFPMAGYTRVIGSQDRFNDAQLNRMAGGGAYILVQDAPGAPIIARQALTTDLTSVETRTDSITKVVDFSAKLLRRALRNFIGRFNITQGFIDSLGSVINGVGGFLVENGILVGFTLNNIIQDEDQPDSVIIDVTLDVPYPCNFIRLTLVI